MAICLCKVDSWISVMKLTEIIIIITYLISAQRGFSILHRILHHNMWRRCQSKLLSLDTIMYSE